MQIIDAVANIWTKEALSYRPDWGPSFFVGKMKVESDLMEGMTLEAMIERMQAAEISRALLIAPKAGRADLKGCYHLPHEVVARAVAQYPDRFSGLIGIDPYTGMRGVQELADAVTESGFVGAHLYPHWFELPPNHAKYYPFYAKCCELDVPIQIQVGQSMIYSKDHPCRSVGHPMTLDAVACDFPELTIIGIHVGIPWTDEMIAMAWKHDNVYIGCDAHSPRYWPENFTRYINSYGQDKVLFGTDFPILDFGRAVSEIRALNLKAEVLNKLFRENAERLYRLS